MKKNNANGHKIKRHKSRLKFSCRQTDYKQCLTVICPTLNQVVGQFCILQLGCTYPTDWEKNDIISNSKFKIVRPSIGKILAIGCVHQGTTA
ncbi:hypothetical protein A6V25_12485 [Nostoc sp. ATCC 53789]|uniref:hypothetical protein n=1 Tax=unclassified Nostoc TaxID=2593658 RepID=UPI000DECA16F|nr:MULTISPECIES: hypothetical protein [unclassified Nostoc]RCJ32203.1 hypothetical protein A6V25_12485 [Nostoc sp. ATCC 53789]